MYKVGSIVVMLVSGLLAAMCSHSKPSHDELNYLDKQIAIRLRLVQHLKPANDSLGAVVSKVDKRVNDLVLLSKDVENLQASVSLANKLFSEIFEEYNMEPSGFVKVHSIMHANEINLVLKQNELSFFNQLILQNGAADSLLFAAP